MPEPRLALALGGLALAAACSVEIDLDGQDYQFDRSGASAEKEEQGRLDPALTGVIVDNRFGEVEVVAGAADHGGTWRARAWARSQEDADRLLRELQLRVEELPSGTRLRVVLPEPERALRGIDSDLLLRVPAGVRVEVENRHGPVRVAGVEAAIEVRAQHGEVEVRDAGGSVEVESAFGAVDLHNVAGRATVRNQHAGVRIAGLRGDASVRSAFGKVEVECHGAEASIQNQHGDVILRMMGDGARSAFARNQFGHTRIEVPDGVAVRIEAETEFGRIETGMDLPDLDRSPIGVQVAGGPEDAPLRVRAVNEHGDIVLRRG